MCSYRNIARSAGSKKICVAGGTQASEHPRGNMKGGTTPYRRLCLIIRSMLIVLTTTPTDREADLLAAKIVEARLGACVQILPQMKSVYVWEGRVRREGEHLLLVKTLPEKFDELSAFITANHSYDVPEIVAIAAERISDAYLEWIKSVMNG